MAIRPAMVVAALAVLTGCGPIEPGQDRFEQTGKLIALSGGDAGPRGACISCHGLRGEGDGNRAPRLASLDQGYFVRELDSFARGQRRHAQMAWIARRLDWPARQKLASYYANLPIPTGAGSAPNAGDCAAQALYELGDPTRGIASCASCHGDDGAGAGAGNPALAAQPAVYLRAQLDAWATGKRYGNPTMLQLSRLLTEEERARLAGYSSALPGASLYPAPPVTCPRERHRDPRNGASAPRSYAEAPKEPAR